MNELLARAGGFFIAADPAQPRRAAARGGTRLVVVLASPGDVLPAAGAVARAVRSEASAPAALLCRPGQPLPARPAFPAAAALARHLAGRGIAATAAAALCRVALSRAPDDAVREIWRLSAAVDVPMVAALPGRLDGFDQLLADADRLYLAAPPETDDALSVLALESLRRLGPPVMRFTPAAGAVGRRLARLGLAAGVTGEGRMEVAA